MKIILLSFISCLSAAFSTEIPNFRSTYTAAREASRHQEKDLVIFFNQPSCDICNAAWSSFEIDALGPQQYISTRINAGDFDGSVLFNRFDLTRVPSWVIISPDGSIKDIWEGGWKDETGTPKTIQGLTPSAIAKTKPAASTTSTPPSQVEKIYAPVYTHTDQPADGGTLQHTGAPHIEKEESRHSKTQPEQGFVLQTGYFGSQPNAEKLRDELHIKGFNDYLVKPTQQNGTTYYRVISGVFYFENEAAHEQEKLAAKSIKASIKKTTEL